MSYFQGGGIRFARTLLLPGAFSNEVREFESRRRYRLGYEAKL